MANDKSTATHVEQPDSPAESSVESCEFPGCVRARQASTAPGPAPRYCDDDRHDRKGAYEARKRQARQHRDQHREQQDSLRDAASVLIPGPVEMGGLRLRDVAARLVETFQREGQVSREYMDALVASVSGIRRRPRALRRVIGLKNLHDFPARLRQRPSHGLVDEPQAHRESRA